MRRNQTGLTYYNSSKTYDGFTLFTPMNPSGFNGQVWLIDMQGEFVHGWTMAHPTGHHGVLLPNGNLLYAGKVPREDSPGYGGSSGELIEVDWDGSELWRYEDISCWFFQNVFCD